MINPIRMPQQPQYKPVSHQNGPNAKQTVSSQVNFTGTQEPSEKNIDFKTLLKAAVASLPLLLASCAGGEPAPEVTLQKPYPTADIIRVTDDYGDMQEFHTDAVSFLEQRDGPEECSIHLGKGTEAEFTVEKPCPEVASAVYPAGTPLITTEDIYGDMITVDKNKVVALEEYKENKTFVKLEGDDDDYFTVPMSGVQASNIFMNPDNVAPGQQAVPPTPAE